MTWVTSKIAAWKLSISENSASALYTIQLSTERNHSYMRLLACWRRRRRIFVKQKQMHLLFYLRLCVCLSAQKLTKYCLEVDVTNTCYLAFWILIWQKITFNLKTGQVLMQFRTLMHLIQYSASWIKVHVIYLRAFFVLFQYFWLWRHCRKQCKGVGRTV